MERAQIEECLRRLLAEASGTALAGVDLRSSFEELGLDSVARVELLAQLEDTYDVHVPPEDALHLNTGGEVARYLTRQLS
jgi:acyl carrier protein